MSASAAPFWQPAKKMQALLSHSFSGSLCRIERKKKNLLAALPARALELYMSALCMLINLHTLPRSLALFFVTLSTDFNCKCAH